MKIGMKEEMGVANEMTSSVLGLHARSACIFAREVHKFTHFHVLGGKVAARIVGGS